MFSFHDYYLALSKDDDYRRRLELIQDFEMKTACQQVKMTNDGEHIILAGFNLSKNTVYALKCDKNVSFL
jgi:ribosome biogenesis protein ENP2